MNIGQRLALSFAFIFLLFAANLAINWWGSSQRANALYQLRNAVDRQLLANQLDQAFSQRKKEISIFHKLRVQIGAKALNKDEAEDIVAKLDRINHLAEQLRRRTDLKNTDSINTFIALYEAIYTQWLRIYTLKTQADYQQKLPDNIVKKAALKIQALKDSEEKTVFEAAQNDEEKAALVKRINLIIFTVSTLLAMLISWLLIHYLRSNIHTLKHGAEAFGQGNLEEHIDIEAKDEFGDLANSFNHMAGALKSAIDEANIARDEAEDANQSKSAFLANMSHELRTPMNAIIGYSEILIEDAEDAGVKEFEDDLNKIRSAGKHLLSLINDVLDISKIEAGKMTVFLESFDLQELINDIVSTIQPLIEQNQNQLAVNFNPLPNQMYADSTKIRQILFNLLSNACKFTENGKITLTVNVDQNNESEMVQFMVEDTGIGMNEEQLSHVFEEFTQADKSTTRKYGGTGLGLTISQRFCTMLGGDISVESASDNGTKFTVLIPLNVADEVELEAAIEHSISDSDSDSGKTVLVIDDDATMHDLLRRFLVKDGFNVVSAMSGEQGIKLARQLKPDVVTLDVMMPRMDGWAVLKALKKDPDTRHIPIIMLTMVDEKNLGYSLGATKFLNKPVERNDLLSTIKNVTHGDSVNELLIVDDDPQTHQLIKDMLKKSGWNIAETTNIEQAKEQLKASIPTVILLDLNFTEMDCLTFLQYLREGEEWLDIPVIVVAGSDLTNQEIREVNNTPGVILIKSGSDQSNFYQHLESTIAEFTKE